MSSGHKAALAVGAPRVQLSVTISRRSRPPNQSGVASEPRHPSTAGSPPSSPSWPQPTRSIRLHLLQEQKDLLDERSRVDQVKDLTALEKQFVKVAKAYGERKGITYGTWRAAGVSAAVLQKAEIPRSRT